MIIAIPDEIFGLSLSRRPNGVLKRTFVRFFSILSIPGSALKRILRYQNKLAYFSKETPLKAD
jgi:hypothetical protein